MATPTGVQTDFVIYDEEFNSSMAERLNVNINLWNGATKGGLVLTTKHTMGHFSKVSMYKRLSQAVVEEFDPRTKGTTTWTSLEGFENASVKVWRDMALSGTLDEFKVMLEEPNATFSQLVGALTADLITKDAVETLVGALIGAIENEPTHVLGDFTKEITFSDINSAQFVYGDSYKDVACILVHSNCAKGLVELNLSEKLDSVAGYSIRTGEWASLGIPVIISDIDSLKSGANNNVLFLKSGGAMCMHSEAVTAVSQIDVDARPMEMKLKREWAFNIGLAGMSYDTSKTAYPTRANLADKTFWKITASDTKDLPVVLFKSKASA